MINSALVRGRNGLRALRHNALFEWFTVAVIILSALTIGVKSYDMPGWANHALRALDWLVTLYFVIEITVRFFADGGRAFWRKGWNIFDFIIVAASLIPVDESEYALLARLLRLFRVMRLVYFVPQLRMMVEALLVAIPRMGYVALMMFIIFYIYGAAGNLFFAKINEVLWGDVGVSMLTLFRVSTFEDWTDVMYETMAVYPFSWIFYLSFIFLTAFVFLNMMIGVVINVMQEAHEKMEADKNGAADKTAKKPAAAAEKVAVAAALAATENAQLAEINRRLENVEKLLAENLRRR